ncbi:hypothetical protein M947_08215 [Sulfurimonas hongkongensis]|uniref:Uncharacterized protein n=1 Tax=Sulfurimonas hongkongensis TaxID=1172190 RepID=T0JDS8_9BACT|nr:hypothetical protein [Sulfurimonas hongkongensis]EQB39135.1 hypothetical protein M947_08215 [Sulfurimonas hongkongensis]
MKFFILWSILLLLVLGGCSSKEFSDGAKDIGNDISKLFEPTN